METVNLLESLLRKGDYANGICKVFNFKETSAVAKGENYGSDTLKWRIETLRNDGSVKTMSFIVKNVPDTPARAEFLNDCGLFKREIKIYRDVTPKMEELMHGANDLSDPVWPKCIGFVPYNKVILEDLTLKGFSMADKREGITIEHAEIFMGALAKFHALSVVMIHKGMIDLEDYEKFLFCRRAPLLENYLKNGLQQVAESIRNNWEPEWRKMADNLSAIADVVMDVAEEGCKRDEEGFNVLCHGDPWTNNMMFKHCPYNGKVIGIKLLDFQLAHYGSYGLDLAYFFYTSTLIDVKNETDRLLKIYHDTLLSTFQQQKFQVNAPTFDEIKREMRKREPVMAALTTSYLHLVTLENEMISDMNIEEMVTNPDKQVPPGALDSKKYIKRIQDNLRHFLDTDDLENLVRNLRK